MYYLPNRKGIFFLEKTFQKFKWTSSKNWQKPVQKREFFFDRKWDFFFSWKYVILKSNFKNCQIALGLLEKHIFKKFPLDSHDAKRSNDIYDDNYNWQKKRDIFFDRIYAAHTEMMAKKFRENTLKKKTYLCSLLWPPSC